MLFTFADVCRCTMVVSVVTKMPRGHPNRLRCPLACMINPCRGQDVTATSCLAFDSFVGEAEGHGEGVAYADGFAFLFAWLPFGHATDDAEGFGVEVWV